MLLLKNIMNTSFISKFIPEGTDDVASMLLLVELMVVRDDSPVEVEVDVVTLEVDIIIVDVVIIDVAVETIHVIYTSCIVGLFTYKTVMVVAHCS